MKPLSRFPAKAKVPVDGFGGPGYPALPLAATDGIKELAGGGMTPSSDALSRTMQGPFSLSNKAPSSPRLLPGAAVALPAMGEAAGGSIRTVMRMEQSLALWLTSQSLTHLHSRRVTTCNLGVLWRAAQACHSNFWRSGSASVSFTYRSQVSGGRGPADPEIEHPRK